MKKTQNSTSTIYYDVTGEGLPILFIHPPGMGRRVFDYQKQLSKKFKVIMPDLSGHGKSTSILNKPIIELYVDEIKTILETENLGQAVICGYSAGGSIAQAFALTYPSNTRALILSSGYPKIDSKILALEYKLGMNILKVKPNTLSRIISFSHTNNREFRDELLTHMNKSKVSYWHQFYLESYHFNCVENLRSFNKNLLLIYGSNEFWSKKHIPYYKKCPKYKIAEITGAFHQLPTKKWHTFNHIITDFMETTLK